MPVLAEKGYHIHVVSWENDADNYKTASVHLETVEQANALFDLYSLLAKSYHSGGIGNICENWAGSNDREEAIANEQIATFFETNPEYLDLLGIKNPNLNSIIPWLHKVELTGENYQTRVASHIELRYIPETIEYELIREEKR